MHHACHSTSICPKWPQSDPKMHPKSHSYAKRHPKATPNPPSSPHIFIESLKYVGKMNVFWKRTFIYPKCFHNHHILIPKWTKVSTIYPKWPQSDPKLTLLCQHWLQSGAKVPPKSPSSAKSKPKVAPKLLQIEIMSQLSVVFSSYCSFCIKMGAVSAGASSVWRQNCTGSIIMSQILGMFSSYSFFCIKMG